MGGDGQVMGIGGDKGITAGQEKVAGSWMTGEGWQGKTGQAQNEYSELAVLFIMKCFSRS